MAEIAIDDFKTVLIRVVHADGRMSQSRHMVPGKAGMKQIAADCTYWHNPGRLQRLADGSYLWLQHDRETGELLGFAYNIICVPGCDDGFTDGGDGYELIGFPRRRDTDEHVAAICEGRFGPGRLINVMRRDADAVWLPIDEESAAAA